MLWCEICMASLGFAMVFFGAGAITIGVFRVGSKVMFPPRLGRFLYRMHKFPDIKMNTSRADTFRMLGRVKNGRFENGIFLDSRRSRRMDYTKRLLCYTHKMEAIMQSKKGSAIETMTNIFIGYWINFLGNWFILPLFGFQVTVSQNIKIGLLFTIISVLRSYGLRRFYNWLGRKGHFAEKDADLHKELTHELNQIKANLDHRCNMLPRLTRACTRAFKFGYELAPKTNGMSDKELRGLAINIDLKLSEIARGEMYSADMCNNAQTQDYGKSIQKI